MKLYQTPGGTWAGTEKDWRTAMKSEGADIKQWMDRRIVEVPTPKNALMEFLTFHNVNCVAPGGCSEVVPVGLPPSPPAPPADTPSTTVPRLDDLFEAAPLRQRLDLAVSAIDAACKQLN